MGAEGKYDLKVVSGGAAAGTAAVATRTTSRKCLSTPSLPDATATDHQMSVASTEQASSADNVSAEEVGGKLPHPRSHATDLSAINNSTHHINSDLATIVESLTLGSESNNCVPELGNNSLSNMEMGPASITDITKPYPAKEPLPESTSHHGLAEGEAVRNNTNTLLSSELLALPASLLHTLRNNANRVTIQCEDKDGGEGRGGEAEGGAGEAQSDNKKGSSAGTAIMSASEPDLTQQCGAWRVGAEDARCAQGARGLLESLGMRSTGGGNAGTGRMAQPNQKRYNHHQLLVRLALSSTNFHSGLLSAAQSYPSLAPAAPPAALAVSLTSTSSDSEQVSLEDFLESCRPPALLAELDDDDDADDNNEDDPNYQEDLLQVSRNLLSLMEEDALEGVRGAAVAAAAAAAAEGAAGGAGRGRRAWDDDYVLKRQFSALIPAFDPRPGRTNLNQTTDLEMGLCAEGSEAGGAAGTGGTGGTAASVRPPPSLRLWLSAGGASVPLDRPGWTIFRAVQTLLLNNTTVARHDRHKRLIDNTYTLTYKEIDSADAAVYLSESDEDEINDPGAELGVVGAVAGAAEAADLTCAVRVLRRVRDVAPALPPAPFLSSKLTNKLHQQLQDPLTLAAGAAPAWCRQLNDWCPFLFPLESRQMFFACTAFGTSRTVVWLQAQRDRALDRQRGTNTLSPRRAELEATEFRMGRLRHERVRIPRNSRLLHSAMQVMRVHAGRKSVLEVEFAEEEGTGLGPTLEFYALVAAELQRTDLGMWLHDRTPGADADAHHHIALGEEKPPGYYVMRVGGLFPAPLIQDSSLCDRVCKYFWFLGVFLAKVLQDGRLVDLPLSEVFLHVMCRGCSGDDLALDHLRDIDPIRHRFIEQLLSACDEYERVEGGEALCVEGAPLEELALTMTYVSDNQVQPLCDSGEHIEVSAENAREYAARTVEWATRGGVVRQLDAFRSGFAAVFPPRRLRAFSPAELRLLVCGESGPAWTRDHLLAYTEPKLGYTRESVGFLRLVDVLVEMSVRERKAFLQFATGCSSLPPGGLANLHPRLTVVRKVEAGDGSYPSVNTCVHYLKLPEYSSKEVLRERLLAATLHHGFHLN